MTTGSNELRERCFARFLHWLGHVLFDMDCGVSIDNATQRATCKRCGREVSITPRAWR